MFYEGEDDLWDILLSILNLRFSKGSIINDRLEANKKKAISLESTIGSLNYDFKSKSKDKQAEAGLLHLKSGDFEKFCESLVKQGKWERALAFAPAVSFQYWNSLVKRYSDSLIQTNHEEACFYFILSNQTSKVKEF